MVYIYFQAIQEAPIIEEPADDDEENERYVMRNMT